MATTGKRAVVIGAGFAGMAAAVRLRARGFAVTVLEANEQPGGRAAVFRRDGFTFDAGPTVITAPYLLEELFALHGRRAADYYTLVPIDPFYRVRFDDGSVFDYVGDEERLLANIAAFTKYPGDVDGYRRFAAHALRIFDVGYTQLADVPFSRLRDMLAAVPAMMRLRNWQTVWRMVARYIKDERLRQVFTFEPLLVGGSPYRSSSIYALIHWVERKWGVHYAMGGTGSIIAGLWKLLGEVGADLHLNAPVERIDVGRDGGHGTVRAVRAVHTADGREFPAEVVVCNADPSVVYPTMIDAAHRRKWSDRRVRRVQPSPSLFVAYFGTKKTYPELAHHTLVLGPRYKGLLHDIFSRRVLADDVSLYLHAPTRTDPSMAPAGHECFYVLSPVPDQRSGIDWQQMQQPYLDRVLARLESTVLPGLRENLVTSFAVDPRYFAGRLRSAHGAAFGPEPTLTQSAWFRYHNVSEDVGNLFFVGAGTHPGAGVPGVLNSARLLERVLPPA